MLPRTLPVSWNSPPPCIQPKDSPSRADNLISRGCRATRYCRPSSIPFFSERNAGGVIDPVKRARASRLDNAGASITDGAGSGAPLEAALKRRVTGGFIVGLLLTICLGVSSWRSTRLAANDADWVAHTYAVMDTIELTTKHVIEFETSARIFAMTGQDPLLARYEAARSIAAQEVDTLRQ